ncbi:hypothetical protein ACFLZN_00105 [Nanoarchaeota archaeon]
MILNRIIGIIALLFSLIVFFIAGKTVTTIVSLLFITGLALVVVPNVYGNKILNAFKKSFKLKASFILVIIYDVLFWFVMIGGIFLWTMYLSISAKKLGLVNVQSWSQETFQQNLSYLSGFAYEAAIAVFILLMILTFAYGLLSMLAWGKVVNKKYSWLLLKKFVGLSFIYMIAFVFFVFLAGGTIKESVLPYALILITCVFAHLISLSNNFIAKHNIRITLKNTLIHGFKLHRFLIPYSFMFFVYFISLVILKLSVYLQSVYLIMFILIVSTLFIIAWFKYFISKVIEVEKW